MRPLKASARAIQACLNVRFKFAAMFLILAFYPIQTDSVLSISNLSGCVELTMAKRKNKKTDTERAQTSKSSTGGSNRGHGVHHRLKKGAPRNIGTGRKRVDEKVREGNWIRRLDDELADLATSQRLGEGGTRLTGKKDRGEFGADLKGITAHGVVLEVRKGFSWVELTTIPEMPKDSKEVPKTIRVRTRGAMKNFDLGFSSISAAGDTVRLLIPPLSGQDDYEGVLLGVEERKSMFRRLHPSGKAIQVLAANVDQVVVVASCAEPPFRPGFVDRVLVCTAACNIAAVIVLNKIDLGISAEAQELIEVYRSLGVTVVETSATQKEGLQGLLDVIKNRRSVFCGHSGVGKSSLLATLAPELEEDIKVSHVSSYSSKGRHTTTHAKLYRMAIGELIDTPGVREFTPADTDRKNLWAWFPEIAAIKSQCTFTDCKHTVEKGCAVLQACEEGQIHPRRHQSYVRILETLPY